MTNEQLVDAAWQEYLGATITPAEWQKRKTDGYKGKPYNWQNTSYGRGNALLDQIQNVAVTPPPPDPPPATGTARPTYQNHLTSGYYASNDGPAANYQVIWNSKNNDYVVRRLQNDSFSGAMLWKPKSPWPGLGPAGNWGRFWNFHNSPGDWKDSSGKVYGWDIGPGNSAFAFDFQNGNISLNLDANGINGTKDFILVPNAPLDHRYSIATDVVWGRTDGGTARKGSVKVWIDGKLVLDNPSCNTVWKWANGQVQYEMIVWAGFYTQDIKPGVTLNWEHAHPWMGTNHTDMWNSPASPGAWTASVFPIDGKDHSDGPAVSKDITSWTNADLVLPAGW